MKAKPTPPRQPACIPAAWRRACAKRNARRRNLILAAAAQKSLRRLTDAEVGGATSRVVAFKDGDDEFRVYFDPKTHLPTQIDILEDDPLEGDSSYLLRYGDWRKVDARDALQPAL